MSVVSTKMLQAAAGASTGGPWDVSSAVYNGSPLNRFNVQETIPQGLFFKSDGTKMYVIGRTGDDVNEYSLSTAWEISSGSYVQSFSVASQETNPHGIFFKPDGAKMYVTGQDSDNVNEYDLSTAWDVSTASYLQAFSIASQENNPRDVFFKSDGTKMYVIGASGDDINEYNLSTAWDLSTASYFQSFSVASQETVPTGLFFKPDGTKMYIIGITGDDVNEYDLSTAWDVSTASYVQNFSTIAEEAQAESVFFKPDGTVMYMLGSAGDSVYSYDLSTAWDISTASFSYPTTDYLDVSAQDIQPAGVSFKTDGTKMYVMGRANDSVYEYDLGTAWDISTASYLQSLNVNTQEAVPEGIFFKPDGTKLYVIGQNGDEVNEYSLSTAWSVVTASYVRNFSVASQELSPRGIFFKDDGTKMYVVGASTSDAIYEYDLSTAWNVSTASYLQTFSVSSQDTAPTDVFFKPDGTKMYVVGLNSDSVNEYDLSTAWDISTASYLQNFSFGSIDNASEGIFFKDDGTKMYIVGGFTDSIYSFDIG